MFGATLAMAFSVAVQDPPAQQVPPLPETSVEEIIVDGRPLGQAAREFVREVAAPAGRRGLALWRGRVCVGVANLSGEAAQYMADRISTVAEDLGLPIGEPGCDANALVIFTADAAEAAGQLIDHDQRIFRVGGGLDRGKSALERFRTSDAPVRWWQISIPTDSDTGRRAVRIAGDDTGGGVMESAPTISVFAASRLNSQIRDDMNRSVVIIDIDDIANVSFEQLTDYVALVTLAQIDPEADTSSFTTVLNIFENPGATPMLSEWDWSYLRALYGSRGERTSPGSQATEVARVMTRDRRAAQIAAADAEQD
ncbi:MAG: hypothetical protein V4707_12695 [Pseudomonadota bacterium]